MRNALAWFVVLVTVPRVFVWAFFHTIVDWIDDRLVDLFSWAAEEVGIPLPPRNRRH